MCAEVNLNTVCTNSACLGPDQVGVSACRTPRQSPHDVFRQRKLFHHHLTVRDKTREEMKQTVKQTAKPQQELAQAFLCPITSDLMTDPVVCPEGHSFERASIES